MQAPAGPTRMRWLPGFGGARLLLRLAATALVCGGLSGAQSAPPRLNQSQAAGQFLRAVLRADYSAAYGRLAPEVRQGISLNRFTAAARPLWQSGRRPGRGTAIELYKLGVRLGDRGSSRLFYSFSFAADSSLRIPSELLEVTFRDTAARVVLGFSRHLGTPANLKKQLGSKPPGR